MEYKHQTKKEAQLMLQYTKRRYDGGSEIELIKLIEAKQALHAAKTKNVEKEKHEQPKTVTRSRRIWESLLLGPMEVAIGLVGLLTTALAIVTFKQQGKTKLVEQSKTVFKDCAYTLCKGLWHLAISPLQVARQALRPA